MPEDEKPSAPQFDNKRAQHLSFAKENSAYNRQWFNALHARVSAGEPLAFVNADIVPTEIFKALDIAVIVNQWWSAVVAAKQKSSEYFGLMENAGHARNLCRYCSLSFAATFEPDPAQAPWGGLPTPSIVVSGDTCNSGAKIFGLWAEKFAIPHFKIDTPVVTHAEPGGWAQQHRWHWDELLGADAVDLLAGQFRELIALLERMTGKRFDLAKLRNVMGLVNEQEEYYFKTRELIAHTRPSPLNVSDQMPATMIPQWHRGTEWGRDRARLFYEETRRKVEAGEGVVENERVRLMWLGTGLWYNLGFYEYFEREYGAVFIWSIYLSVASDAYPTYGDEDPVRTLAARMLKINTLLSAPPFNTAWYVAEARKAGIDGVVIMSESTDEGCQQSIGADYLIEKALRDAGVPILRLGVDNTDAAKWDDQAIRRRVAEFIERDLRR